MSRVSPFAILPVLFIALWLGQAKVAAARGDDPSSSLSGSPSPSPATSLSPAPSPSPTPTPTPAPDPIVKIDMKAGQNIVVSWPDGREARAFYAVSEIKHATMPIQVTENLCTDVEPVSCQLQAAYKLSEFRLQWTVNPDSTKIGKTVRLVFSPNNKQKVYGQGLMVWSNKPATPIAAADLPPDEITCPDYSWLPGGTPAQAPLQTNIIDWVADRMSTNPETGIDENRTVGGAYDVSLSRASDGGILFDGIGHLTGEGTPILYGDVVSWFMNNPARGNNECQITLKPDSTGLSREIMKGYGVFDKATFNRYVYKSDEYMSVSLPFVFLVDFVNERVPMVDAKGNKIFDKNGSPVMGYLETETE